jgi:RNA-directed DNA polymerase
VKRVKVRYNDPINYKNIEFIYKKIRKGIRNKRKLVEFDNFYTANISHIYYLLLTKSYVCGNYNVFKIYEPKERIIMSQDIGNKIVNHFVAYFYLMPILELSMIDANVATRKGMGTRYGLNKLKKYLNEYKNDEFYILKCDIKGYFYNIDHEVLKNMLRKKIYDLDILNLVFNIIDSTQSGLPIGNMSSQILAIYYLSDLDHYIKEHLHIKGYVRYMDDIILMERSKDYLQLCLYVMELQLSRLKLKLNNKTTIFKGNNGINFLGYRFIFRNNKLLVLISSKNRRKILLKYKLYKKGLISYQSIISYNGFIGYSINKYCVL